MDDRANAMLALSGLAGEEDYALITDVVMSTYEASPFIEKYVLEALCVMGRTDLALQRMRERYAPMLQDEYDTLWETFHGVGAVIHILAVRALEALLSVVGGPPVFLHGVHPLGEEPSVLGDAQLVGHGFGDVEGIVVDARLEQLGVDAIPPVVPRPGALPVHRQAVFHLHHFQVVEEGLAVGRRRLPVPGVEPVVIHAGHKDKALIGNLLGFHAGGAPWRSGSKLIIEAEAGVTFTRLGYRVSGFNGEWGGNHGGVEAAEGDVPGLGNQRGALPPAVVIALGHELAQVVPRVEIDVALGQHGLDGALKRGPTPYDSYYDTVELTNLKQGENTIALLVAFNGRSGDGSIVPVLLDEEGDEYTQAGLIFELDAGCPDPGQRFLPPLGQKKRV
mgnify:CR=1 FL=1